MENVENTNTASQRKATCVICLGLILTEAGDNIDGEVIEIKQDEGFDLHKSGAETMSHTNKKEAEHDDKQLIAKLCKICSTGKKGR